MLTRIKALWASFREKLKGYKTIVWNVFLGVLPVLLVALDKLQALDLTPYMTPWAAVGVGFIVSSVGVYLRYISVGPVGSKGDEQPPAELKAGD